MAPSPTTTVVQARAEAESAVVTASVRASLRKNMAGLLMFHVVPLEWSKGMGGAVGEPSASGARSFVFKPRATSGGSEYAWGRAPCPLTGRACIRLYI